MEIPIQIFWLELYSQKPFRELRLPRRIHAEKAGSGGGM